MTTRLGNWMVTTGLMCGGLFWAVACEPEPTPHTDGGPGNLDGGALVEALRVEVILPSLYQAVLDMDTLEGAMNAWALDTASASAKSNAQTAWRAAMRRVQRLEVMQFGPAADPAADAAGLGLRTEIYSFPSTNRCTVEQKLTSEAFRDDGFTHANLVSAYGLDALEVLLFVDDGEGNSCAPQNAINRDGEWDAWTSDEREALRAEMGAMIAGEALETLLVLEEHWVSGEAVESVEEAYSDGAIERMFHALFYLENVTKDRKLGTPLGLIQAAPTPNLDLFEHRYSTFGANAIVANIDGFLDMWLAGGSAGFGGRLTAAGQRDLHDQLMQALVDARSLAVSLEDSSLAEHSGEAEALYDALKVAADLLKGDVADVLMLDVPAEAAGDND